LLTLPRSQKMTSKEAIFISYRRSDSQDMVGRIDDYLTDHFGREHVFLDRNSIDYGAVFPDRLKQAIQDSKVVLVVIGADWSSVRDEKGRRLENPDDWVRQEIALALEQRLVVIPVLLDGTNMPSPRELPQTIQKLAERNAIDLITRKNTNLFKAGMAEIITLIEKQVPELRPAPPITFDSFEFEVVTLQIQTGLFGKKVIRQSQKKTAKQYIEDLGNGVYFEMVFIPGGSFIMGTPASEKDSYDNERPQHRVTVPPFLMGKYAVTQRLWQTVASFPKVERELELNPSSFKGDQRPVEDVSWFDAVEFCQRLSRETGRRYRLPSEAEWEYACRAGTTTPFHFGETITAEWVNCIGTSP
jgi:hypothetical protein